MKSIFIVILIQINKVQSYDSFSIYFFIRLYHYSIINPVHAADALKKFTTYYFSVWSLKRVYICTCSTLLVVEWASRAWLGVFALRSPTFGAVWWRRIKPNPTTGWIHCTRVLAISQRKRTGPIGIACHHFCPMIYKCCCTSCWNSREKYIFWYMFEKLFFSIYNVIVTINHVI